MTTNTQRIEVFFDGIEGHTHTYGGAHSDCDLGGMGYGRNYQEAVDDALAHLADVCPEIDLGHNTETTDAVWAEVKRRAAALDIDLASEREVEQVEAEIAAEYQKAEGCTAEQAAEEAAFFWGCDSALGIVLRFHGFLGDA